MVVLGWHRFETLIKLARRMRRGFWELLTCFCWQFPLPENLIDAPFNGLQFLRIRPSIEKKFFLKFEYNWVKVPIYWLCTSRLIIPSTWVESDCAWRSSTFSTRISVQRDLFSALHTNGKMLSAPKTHVDFNSSIVANSFSLLLIVSSSSVWYCICMLLWLYTSFEGFAVRFWKTTHRQLQYDSVQVVSF